MKTTFKLIGDGSLGTAFVIGRPTEKDPNRAHTIMVTAAHVLEGMKGSRATLLLRRKKADGSYEKVKHSIEIRRDGNPLWTRHPDSVADVAAMYVDLPRDMDLTVIPISMLADDEILEKYEVHPGDEVMCLGFPLGAEANEAGFPILRSGKIASYPLIPTEQTKTFLYTFQVFEGNSGGPVYLIESARAYAGAIHIKTIQYIVGVISEQRVLTQTTETLREVKEIKYPLDLAVVVHARFIKETVEKLPPLE